MTLTDGIAAVAILVSLLSAIYARWSVKEARKANKISLMFEKVEIYKEVIKYSDYFHGLFANPDNKQLDIFRKKVVEPSEIYFSKKIHEKLRNIYGKSNTYLMHITLVQDNPDMPDQPSEHELRSEFKNILEELYPILEEMKQELSA